MDNFCDTILPYHNCEWTKILARYQSLFRSHYYRLIQFRLEWSKTNIGHCVPLVPTKFFGKLKFADTWFSDG